MRSRDAGSRRWVGAFAALLMVSSVVVVVADAEPVAAAVGTEPVVHFVVDVSGSMSGARLTEAKAAIVASVDAMPDGVALGLRSYAGSCSQPAAPLVPIATGNEATIISAVNGLTAGGGTPTADAVQRGIDEVDAYATSGEKRLVLLTDGFNTCPATVCATVQDNLDLGIEFNLYTVGLGASAPVADLECAAEATGGEYLPSPTPEDLAETIADAVTAGSYEWSFWEFFGRRPSGEYAGDPVGTAYGNFHDTFTDLPAQAGVYGLDVTRSYNSLDEGASVLGVGWRAPFSMTATSEGDDVRLTVADGRQIPFVSDGSGGWDQPAEFAGVLSVEGDGSHVVIHPDGERWDFDTDGRLESMTGWDGQAVTITRNTAGDPVSVTSSLGPSLAFTYASGRLSGVSASDGRSVSYGYDANGNLVSFTDPTTAVTTYGVDDDGRIETITDPTGVVLVDNIYNTRGRVKQQATPDSTSTFEYNFLARTTTVTLQPLGEAITYTHDAQGRVVQITDANGEHVERTYGTGGWMASGVSRLGAETVLGFDTSGNPTSVADPATGLTTYTYDSQNRVETATTPATGTTSYGYSGTDRIPSTIIDADGKITQQVVTNGLLASVTDPDGVTVLYRHNTLRQLIETEDAYGNVTEFEYDAAGRPNAIEMPSGDRTESVYDAAGRIKKVTAADTGETSTVYDAAGRVKTVTDPEGGVTSYDYDPVTGLLDFMTDPMLRVTNYDYDDVGQLTKTTFADSSFTESDYGLLGRVDAARDELGRQTDFEYDADGNVILVRDPEGGEVKTLYDTAGRVTKVTDLALRETTYGYDPVTGQLESVTSPDGVTAYTYDDLGRPETVTDPRGATTTTSYTDAGRVDTVTTPLGVTDNDYDNAGRLESVEAPGGLATVTEYDQNSWVAKTTSPGGLEASYTYDPVGRVATITDPAGVVTTTTYTKRGETKTVGRTGEGTVEYHYYADGILEWVDDALDNRTSFTYDNRGRLDTRTDPNLKQWKTDYNSAGELVSETDPLLRSTLYGYDDAGRLESTADPSGRTTTNVWRTDGLMDSWSATDGTNTLAGSYTYDAAGRRKTATVDAKTWTYEYNSVGDLESVADPDGAEIGYTWDVAGRRETITGMDGFTQRYVYDTAGDVERIRTRQYMADRFVGDDGAELDPAKWVRSGSAKPTIEGQAASFTVTDTPGSSGWMRSQGTLDSGYDTTYTLDLGDRTKSTKTRGYNRYVTGDSWDALEFKSDSDSAVLKRKVFGWTIPLGTTDVPTSGKVQVRMHSGQQWLHLKVWPDGDPEPEAWDLGVQNGAPSWWGKPEWQVTGSAPGTANTVTVDDVSIAKVNYLESDLVAYQYNDDHQKTTETLPMGAVRTWGYEDGRVKTMSETGAGLGSSYAIDYDTSGRIDTETANGNTINYGYDPAGQLTSITPTGGPTETITYTDLGQRNTHTTTAGTTTHIYNDAAELTSTTGATNTTYASDGAGRRLTETTGTDITSYHYDPAGRHLGVTDPTGTTLRSLDPAGNPEQVVTTPTSGPAETTRLQWDTTQTNAQLTATADTAGSVDTLIRAHETDAWSAITSGTTTQPLAADIHGSTVAGGPAASHATATSYNAFGQPAATPDHQPTLGYRSETTIGGLTHLRARQYDSATGAFTTTDPLPGVNGTTTLNNPYHYTNNNPLNLTDPSGLRANEHSFDPLSSAKGWDPTRFLGQDCGGFGSGLDEACQFVQAISLLTYGDCLSDELRDFFGLCVSAVQDRRHAQWDQALQQSLDIIGSFADVFTSLIPGADCIKSIDNHNAANLTGCALTILPIIGVAISKGFQSGDTAAAVIRAEARAPSRAAVGLADDALPAALRGGPSDVHVYMGIRDGKPVYTGITNNLGRRQAQHGDRFVLQQVTSDPLTRGQARAIEQALIARNPGFENAINSISPRHSYYQQAVDWGEAWLRANGYG